MAKSTSPGLSDTLHAQDHSMKKNSYRSGNRQAKLTKTSTDFTGITEISKNAGKT